MKLDSTQKWIYRCDQPPSGGCVLKPFLGRLYVKLPKPAAFRRLCVETSFSSCAFKSRFPAAFRRLCVETWVASHDFGDVNQPPSGGCVLKRYSRNTENQLDTQPPSGGCVLKRIMYYFVQFIKFQPPSGGCVLKHYLPLKDKPTDDPAAFRRLCVETSSDLSLIPLAIPAAFRRLCVETALLANQS